MPYQPFSAILRERCGWKSQLLGRGDSELQLGAEKTCMRVEKGEEKEVGHRYC